MKKRTDQAFDPNGSDFDSFLEEEGIRWEVEAVAVKRVLAWQLRQAMREQHKTKKAMAEELQTSRSQLDRLLDPSNTSVSLETIPRAAGVLGRRVVIRISDVTRNGPVRQSAKHVVRVGAQGSCSTDKRTAKRARPLP